jgi:hypothetical protein
LINQIDDVIVTRPQVGGIDNWGRPTLGPGAVPSEYGDALIEAAEHQIQWLIQHGLGNAVVEESRGSATILLAALAENTTDPEHIAQVTGYEREAVEQVAINMRNGELWIDDQVHCDHWFDAKCGLEAFCKDLMVADGRLLRYRSAYGLIEYFDPSKALIV